MTHTSIVLTALLAAALPATAGHGEGEESKHRRVVKVVMADEEGSSPGYVVVGPDGEHVAAHSFFFRRGGYLGVQLMDLTPELRRHFGVPEESGVMISGISEEGPASAAGLRAGDIVTAVDGEAIGNGGELAHAIRKHEEGDAVVLEVWRDGKMQSIEATLAERKRPQIDIGPMVWQGKGFELPEIDVELPESVVRIDPERFEKALADLHERLESPEFKARLQEMVEKRQRMDERMRELEERMRELEKELSKLEEERMRELEKQLSELEQ
jgi:membrane-associated protease RseP (regulator of RpoE activity)